MSKMQKLFEQNQQWAENRLKSDPNFFKRLSNQQAPKILWIGCSDSRVPANEIVGLDPGELFVHRNIANVVANTDMNCLSVLQYAVEILCVEDIIVCGHYGCGGILAAMGKQQLGLLDNWLRNLKDVYRKNQECLMGIADQQQKMDLFCELNVSEQVIHVCHTTIVQNAWQSKKKLTVHGWIYSVQDGLLHDLGVSINSSDQIEQIYHVDSRRRNGVIQNGSQ